MKAKLIMIISEEDNNKFTTELAKYFKEVELLMDPQWRMSIRVGNVQFFINHIVQDIRTKTILLYEYRNLHYRTVDEEFKKIRELLSNDEWKLL